jgi:hypothetical protein
MFGRAFCANVVFTVATFRTDAMFCAIGNGSTIAAASGKTRAQLLTSLLFANKRLRIIKPSTSGFSAA